MTLFYLIIIELYTLNPKSTKKKLRNTVKVSQSDQKINREKIQVEIYILFIRVNAMNPSKR